MKSMVVTVLAVAIVLLSGCSKDEQAGDVPSPTAMSLADAYAVISSKKFVDLTHEFEPGIPHWKGFPDETRETLYWYEKGKGKLG